MSVHAAKTTFSRLLEGVDTARLDELAPACGFRELPVSARHATAVAQLPRHHADPFDRLLVAQARVESAGLVSLDPALKKYDLVLVSRWGALDSAARRARAMRSHREDADAAEPDC